MRVRLPRALALVLALAAARALPAQERSMVLTFDDLPGSALAPEAMYPHIMHALRDSLAVRRVHAIGFVNEGKLYDDGRLVPERVALLRAWLDSGFALGNHGFAHRDLHAVSLRAWLADVIRGETVTRRLLAARRDTLRWFRHPYLHTGRSLETRDSVTRTLARRGVRVAPVTMDNEEYIFARAYDHVLTCGQRDAAGVVAAAYLAYMDSVVSYHEAQARLLFGRDIPHVLLLHANRLNAAVGGVLVDAIRGRGYRFTTLDSALADSAYASPDTWTGPGGITWVHRWVLTRDRALLLRGEPPVPEFVADMFQAAERRECR